TLESTPGPLPLLQFSAAKLWALRDKQRRVLTRESYLSMGGVAGALATHADEVLATFTATDQKIVRAIFQRLVTPERTRAVVDKNELREIAPDVERLIGRLVEARLLVVQTRGETEGAVELVHESLIRSWPTLQRWLDENQEHAAYLSQIAIAAKAWDAKGRPSGLLWTGEAMEEARLFTMRFRGRLPERDHAFLAAVNELATRATRRKRRLVLWTITMLALLTAATLAALVYIRQQQQIAEARRGEAETASKIAREQAIAAREAKDNAQREAERATRAETEQRAQYEKLVQAIEDKNEAALLASRSEMEKLKAQSVAKKATAKVVKITAQTEEQKKKAAADALAAEKKRKEDAKKGQITNTLDR
ncbi:MAG TPA: AAA family ATPase, partial [Casimicrobiaceae bacterium]|nr:AAA family ATPase [Casimicrobiaceae bacterium]